LAIVVAVVLNLILYFIATAINALPAENTMGQQITLTPVLIFTVVPAILAAILYYVLVRFLDYERANRWFLVVASIVLIAMAITPITNLVDPTVDTVLILEVMHLAAGLPVMYFLTKSAE
jgi:hypothetical protein